MEFGLNKDEIAEIAKALDAREANAKNEDGESADMHKEAETAKDSSIYTKFRKLKSPAVVLDGKEFQKWNASKSCEGYERFVPDSIDVASILEEVAKKGLTKDNEAMLERYYCFYRDYPGFRESFVRDYSAAREVYLHHDDDRSVLAYVLTALALFIALMPSVVNAEMQILGYLLLVYSVAIVIYYSIRKAKGNIRNMEKFYRYINRHYIATGRFR